MLEHNIEVSNYVDDSFQWVSSLNILHCIGHKQGCKSSESSRCVTLNYQTNIGAGAEMVCTKVEIWTIQIGFDGMNTSSTYKYKHIIDVKLIYTSAV